MKNRLFTIVTALLLGSTIALHAATEPAGKPNILFILVDDMGWGDPSCYGGVGVPTPSLDLLAREGARFTQFYVASPICSASRCGFITGRFPARSHITSYLQTRAGNRECEQADFLDPKAPSFVRAFQSAGYATAHIGKWHLGGGRDVTDAPKFSAYGYDLGLGTYESPEPAAPLGLKSVPWGSELEPQQVARHARTRWMVDQAIAFATEHASRPWLVNLWFDDVHTPHRPSAEQRARADDGKGTAEFRAVLQETDREIGRLLHALRELRQDSNTLVLLAGDNGPEPSFDRARSGGLRGMKWSLYEGGIRTPLMVRWPGVVPSGVVNETTVVSAVDLFPTLCRLANVPLPHDTAFDGEDLSPVFRGARSARTKPLFWEYGRKSQPSGAKGLRAFPFPDEPAAKSPNVAIREGNWKLLINADGSGVELYDLSVDPIESKNVASERSTLARRLGDAALAWRREVDSSSAPNTARE